MAYEDASNETMTRAIGRVIDDVRDLFREEVALAKAELRHEASAVVSAAARMGIGAGAALFAVTFLLLGLAQGFAALMDWPAWAGYLTMGVVLGIGAAIALMAGRSRARQIATLPRTAET